MRNATALLLLSTLASTVMAIDVNALWDYSRPEVSEQRFVAALTGATENEQLILKTQIARTYGLRRAFAKAREVLAAVEPALQQASAEVQVRYFLELGRTYASPVHPKELRTAENLDRARTSFLHAYELADRARLDFLAIDALHMMPAVDEAPGLQLEWDEKAIAYMERSDQADAKRWEGSLRNNVGHAKRLQGDHDGALAEFKRSRAAHEREGRVRGMRIADWMIARTYRDQRKYKEALALQLELERAWDADGEPDPYVYEELGHLYRAMGDLSRARQYDEKYKAASR